MLTTVLNVTLTFAHLLLPLSADAWVACVVVAEGPVSGYLLLYMMGA
jgi:hypothetical protein